MTKSAFTTSDQIKDILSVTLQTEADDWKRQSKKKNEQGEWVREFTNGATKETVIVTEAKTGGFSIKTGNGEDINITLEIADYSRGAKDPSPVLVTDAKQNAAADKVMAWFDGEEDEPDYKVKDQQVIDAGRALANRFYFAVSESDGMIYAMMTSAKYFEKTGAASESSGPLSHLMPKAEEMSEASWQILDVKTPAQAAVYLQQQGFVWNSKYQEIIDGDQTHAVEKALKNEAKAAAKPAITAPQP